MTILYLITAIFFTLVASFTTSTPANNLVFRFPSIIGAVTYGILVGKGFGLI